MGASIAKETRKKMDVTTNDASTDDVKGVRGLWSEVNHVAIVVADVGRSLEFYTEIVGMEQILRPDFDRHGAWLTFGNLDLHLIKGRPAVHNDDDLIVSHIAIVVEDMIGLRAKLAKLGVKSRQNVSVPNPAEGIDARVDQAFVRDPDGYYIEFCSCAGLEEFLRKKRDLGIDWSLSKANGMAQASKVLKQKADISKQVVRWLNRQSSLDSMTDTVSKTTILIISLDC